MRGFKIIIIATMLMIFPLESIKAQGFLFGGIGGAYELEEGLTGFNARVFYGPNEEFCFGPEISFFPLQEIETDTKVSIIDLNVNAHYIFEIAPNLAVYPLSGLNFTKEKVRVISEEENDNAFGINYGAGLHFEFDQWFAFAEFKGVISELSADFVTIGVIFNISSEQEE